MKELTMDLKNYREGGSIFRRTAVRGIVCRDNRYLVISGKHGDYKFPGGGQEPGETLLETLAREMEEETGYRVIPGSIREFLSVQERRKGQVDEILEMKSWYFFCETEEEPGEQRLDEYEKEEGYRAEWLPLEEAVRRNEALEEASLMPWTVRETTVMRELCRPEGMDYRMKAQKLTIPGGHRIILTSDIHGNLPYLQGLLEKLQYTAEDYLLIAGDMLDKGEHSLATLRYLMELSKTHPVYAVYGNVDAKVVDCLTTPERFEARYWFVMRHCGSCVYEEMMREQGIRLHVPEGYAPEIQDITERREVSAEEAAARLNICYRRELDYIRQLPVILDTGSFLVTHAGLPREQYESLEPEEIRQMIQWKNFMEEDIAFSRYVFVGHWPVTIYEREQMDCSPMIDRRKRIAGLDGGCVVKREGRLNAVVLPDITAAEEDWEITGYDAFPVVRVLEDQEESPQAFYARFRKRFVEMVEQGEEASLVRFKHSGEEHRVPNYYLWEKDDGLCCGDYTDYRMPLRAGEEVTLLYELEGSFLLRRDGVAGWYDGKIQRLV